MYCNEINCNCKAIGLTGQISSLGVPNTRSTQHNCSISFSPLGKNNKIHMQFKQSKIHYQQQNFKSETVEKILSGGFRHRMT